MPFALAMMVINVLVTRDGATVLFRGPYLPWAGQVDFTLEALVYGGLIGLRALGIFWTAVFLTAAIDADELLRGLRRVSLRSGVTAALAMRLFGVLRRDAVRMAEAQRCLPDGGASRIAVLHAVTTGALDRATDVAATLEVRGFGAGGRPPRMHRPWSRHDFAFAASAVAMLVIAVGVLLDAWGSFEAYPRLHVAAERRHRGGDRGLRGLRAAALRRPPRDRAMKALRVDGRARIATRASSARRSTTCR